MHRIFTDDHVDLGADVSLAFSPDHVHLFDDTGARIAADGEQPL